MIFSTRSYLFDYRIILGDWNLTQIYIYTHNYFEGSYHSEIKFQPLKKNYLTEKPLVPYLKYKNPTVWDFF